MTIPTSAIGTRVAPLQATVERGRLRSFARAIGETDPVFSDLAAARNAGYRDLPVPPTFLFGLKLEAPDPFAWLTDLGIDLRHILHGTQRFTYVELAFAGDVLDVESRITDVFDKRGGALEFVTVESAVTRAGDPVATLTETIVVRHPEPASAR